MTVFFRAYKLASDLTGGAVLWGGNGVLGGIFSPESWTLSQSYYYGSVARNPSHRVQLIEGAPINLRDACVVWLHPWACLLIEQVCCK